MPFYEVLNYIGLFSGIIASLASVIWLVLMMRKKDQSQTELEQMMKNMLEDKTDHNNFMDKRYVLQEAYHSQGLNQARNTYIFSLIFASVGFIYIIFSLSNVDKGVPISNQSQAIIGLGAGTIIDAVSALFFVQSNKARQLMADFFDRLRTDRKLEEALKLVNETSDNKIKDILIVILSTSFTGSKVNESSLNLIVTSLLGIKPDKLNEEKDAVDIA